MGADLCRKAQVRSHPAHNMTLPNDMGRIGRLPSPLLRKASAANLCGPSERQGKRQRRQAGMPALRVYPFWVAPRIMAA